MLYDILVPCICFLNAIFSFESFPFIVLGVAFSTSPITLYYTHDSWSFQDRSAELIFSTVDFFLTLNLGLHLLCSAVMYDARSHSLAQPNVICKKSS
jgi:hypothetical protein